MISEKVAECITRMQDEIPLCVQQSYEEVLELVKQEIGVQQGRSCGPYRFNIFTRESQ